MAIILVRAALCQAAVLLLLLLSVASAAAVVADVVAAPPAADGRLPVLDLEDDLRDPAPVGAGVWQ